MSDPLAPKSHTMTWTISVLAALLLYVATWPLVEIKTTTVTVTALANGNTWTTEAKPVWVDVLYWPLQKLRRLNGGQNALADYYLWWEARLHR